jgi:hypothetical protein
MLVSPSFADDERFVTACEIAIKSRLPVPEAYKRISQTTQVHALTADEFKSKMIKFGTPAAKATARANDILSGKWAPIDVRVLIDYEGTDAEATVLHKRSYCYMRIDGQEGAVLQPMVRLDGMLGAGGKWVKLGIPE